MGIKNYLIEGVSCTGKTTVCDALQQRGYHAIHGDRVLAYQGDPETGLPTNGHSHLHHIWDVDKVKALIDDKEQDVTFFCGGSRNFSKFIDLFDKVFVLTIDCTTLEQRLDKRPSDEWGSTQEARALIIHLHQTQEDVPTNAISIDATVCIDDVVDTIIEYIKK